MNYGSWSNLNSAASIYLKIKKYDQAHELLSRLGTSLLKEKPADSDPEMEKRQYSSLEYTYWSNMGKWARAAGHKLEALTYERNSMLAQPSTDFNQSAEQYRTSRCASFGKTSTAARMDLRHG